MPIEIESDIRIDFPLEKPQCNSKAHKIDKNTLDATMGINLRNRCCKFNFM